jgi:hypothetical protein
LALEELAERLEERLEERLMVFKVQHQHLMQSAQLVVVVVLMVVLKMVVLVALVAVVLVAVTTVLVHRVKETMAVVVQTIQVQKV